VSTAGPWAFQLLGLILLRGAVTQLQQTIERQFS
jgi:hypothetical protein